MILKDRFLTQSAPDIHCKLLKRAYGPNHSTYSATTSSVYYCRENEETKESQKRIREQETALTMSMKTILKQPEKNAQRDPGEKGWTCSYCGKEGLPQEGLPSGIQAPPSSKSSLQGTTLE